MMRLARTLAVLLLLSAAGCRFPEDSLFVYGRALQADGTPLEGAVLTAEWAPSETELDLPPGSRPKPREILPYGASTTEADGDFTLEFRFGDVLDFSGRAYRQPQFRLASPLDARGQGTFLAFTFTDDVELPVLRPWDARLTITPGARGPRLDFAPAPPVPELPPSASAPEFFFDPDSGESLPIPPTTPEPLLRLSSGGEPVWQRTGPAPWEPGPYVLEDFAAPQAQLRAVSLGLWYFTPLGGAGSSLAFRQEWRTAPERLPGGSLRPISRGAPCLLTPEGPCPWTDGQLVRVELPRDGEGVGPRAFQLTLAEPTRLERLLLRGLEYEHLREGTEHLRVEGSLEGTTWFSLGEALLRDKSPRERSLEDLYSSLVRDTYWYSPFDAPLELEDAPLYLELPLKDAGPVRHVRLRVVLRSELVSPLSALSEVSLFAAE